MIHERSNMRNESACWESARTHGGAGNGSGCDCGARRRRNHVYMTGPVVEVFSGGWPDSLR